MSEERDDLSAGGEGACDSIEEGAPAGEAASDSVALDDAMAKVCPCCGFRYVDAESFRQAAQDARGLMQGLFLFNCRCLSTVSVRLSHPILIEIAEAWGLQDFERVRNWQRGPMPLRRDDPEDV